MLDPAEIDLTPDGSIGNSDVVLIDRFAELAASYRKLHEAYTYRIGSGDTSCAARVRQYPMRQLTVVEKIGALLDSAATHTKIVTKLYYAQEPVSRQELCDIAGIIEASWNPTIARMRTLTSVNITCVSRSTHVYDAKTDTAQRVSYYVLDESVRQRIDFALAHSVVAYGSDEAIIAAILAMLRVNPSMSINSIADRTGYRDMLDIVKIVARRMLINDLVNRRAGLYRITSAGLALVRAEGNSN
jgi:hypothetical protein